MPEEEEKKEQKPELGEGTTELSKSLPFFSTEQFAPIQHLHSGTDTPKIRASNLQDNLNIFKTTSTMPSTEPGNSLEKIVIWRTSAGSIRLCAWNTTTNSWGSVILT